jgi:hypothetical protein
MRDLLYVLGTVVVFTVMLAYLRACEVLGRRGEAEGSTDVR